MIINVCLIDFTLRVLTCPVTLSLTVLSDTLMLSKAAFIVPRRVCHSVRSVPSQFSRLIHGDGGVGTALAMVAVLLRMANVIANSRKTNFEFIMVSFLKVSTRSMVVDDRMYESNFVLQTNHDSRPYMLPKLQAYSVGEVFRTSTTIFYCAYVIIIGVTYSRAGNP